MPRYFFDVETGGRLIRGDVGIELRDAGQIWPEIARLINDSLHDGLAAASSSCGCQRLDVTVRDERGTVVERSTTTLPVECGPLGARHAEHPAPVPHASGFSAGPIRADVPARASMSGTTKGEP